ncbi:long-chain-fatty-acid--CoA ligase [Actinomycetospora aeridis]|uniref:Long-chain-fatty-acid--CoA ligase n=1 Tax=Actinomycetospora aeridis TaxID=3129231 RepID=A0ABU8N9Y1_9PSEU
MTTGATTGVITGRGMTLSDIQARWARVTPDAEFLVDGGGERRTYARSGDRITRLANVLAAEGVEPGDRVAVLGLNAADLLESYLAVLRAGAICVPVNFRLVAKEVAYALDDSGAVVAIADTATSDLLRDALPDAPGVRRTITIGGDLEQVLAAADPTYRELAVPDDATAFIMYTSGTTGAPKGAMLTHRNLYLHAFSSTMHLGGPGGPGVWLSGTPLFHIAGVAGFLPSLFAGGTTVIPPSTGFDPDAMLATLERERVSACFFVPAQWAALCARVGARERDLSALRKASWGAAPASDALLRTMIETFPDAEIVTSFGQTECSPVTTTLRGEDAVRKIGSVGTPMINVEVRVVDDDMRDVASGEVGEIVYRGPLVMSGYWNKPEQTAEAFRGGWFHSGDLVRQDPDGYYYVVDRKKDMIISGGENIYCAEVENVLAGHPQVADVALIGVADPTWGETPLAVIVPKDPDDPPTAASIDDHCREHLARYKRPRRIALVDVLPRNATGKVQKTVLRDRDLEGSLASEVVA